MQVTEKDSTTTRAGAAYPWNSYSLGGVGNFFHVAVPAKGDYARDAIEIARAAELEYDPHKTLLKRSTYLWEQVQASHFLHLTSQLLPAALMGALSRTPSRNEAAREQHLVKQKGREKTTEQNSQG